MVKHVLFSKSLKPKCIFSLASVNLNSLSNMGKSVFSINNSFKPFRYKISYNSQISDNKVVPKKNISSYINDSSFSI